MYLKLQIEATASFYTHDIVRLLVLESSFITMEFIHFQPLLCQILTSYYTFEVKYFLNCFSMILATDFLHLVELII